MSLRTMRHGCSIVYILRRRFHLYFAAFAAVFGMLALPIWLLYIAVKWLVSRGDK